MVSLTPAIDILGVNVGLSEVSADKPAISSIFWGTAQPLRWGNDKTFNS